MKKIVVFVSFLMLSACQAPLAELGKQAGCVAKGTNCDENRDDLQQQIGDLNQELELLKKSLAASIQSLQVQVSMLETLMSSATSDITVLQNSSTTLQNSVNNLTVQMAVLNGYDHIVSIVDPCGNHPTKVDEVFLKLSDGKLIASFSDNANGLNTRFVVLTNGSYATTDGTGCSFTVSGSGNVVSPSIEY